MPTISISGVVTEFVPAATPICNAQISVYDFKFKEPRLKGTAITGADGRYALDVDLKRGNDGWVNCGVRAERTGFIHGIQSGATNLVTLEVFVNMSKLSPDVSNGC